MCRPRTISKSCIATVLSILLMAAACGDDGAIGSKTGTPTSAHARSDRGWLGGEPGWTRASGDEVASDGGFDTAAGSIGSSSGSKSAGGAPVPMSESGDDIGEGFEPVESGPGLSAGSVDDNELWEQYLLYREEFSRLGISVHDVDVRGRRIITVRTPSGTPVLGARIRVLADGTEIADLRTFSDGRAMFFAPVSDGQGNAVSLSLEVSKAEVSSESELDADDLTPEVTLDVVAITDPIPLDILFLLDATGSMGDEIDRLSANMISVAQRVAELEPHPDVRFALTVYRDRGDSFVTRTFDFTGDVDAFTQALREVVAGEGGDTPESLNAGLHEALTAPDWRGEDAVKLIFLVADAPPHLDYEDDADYAADALEAARRGIKIEPIASSGLDDQGEFIFRQLAQLTMARFTFLTYGADGGPGDSTTHSVEDYAVLSLDDLVVRLISDEIGALVADESDDVDQQ